MASQGSYNLQFLIEGSGLNQAVPFLWDHGPKFVKLLELNTDQKFGYVQKQDHPADDQRRKDIP